MSTGTRPRGPEQEPRESTDPHSEVAREVRRGFGRVDFTLRETLGLVAGEIRESREQFFAWLKAARRGARPREQRAHVTPPPPRSPETPVDEVAKARAKREIDRTRGRS